MRQEPRDAGLIFKQTMEFEYGVPQGMLPGVVRLVAENPGPFTFKGTNTYLVGSTSLGVIDPGPEDARHRAAILAAAGGRPITHILITHAHRDHVDGAASLKAETGAEIVGFGRSHLDQPAPLFGPSGRQFVDVDFTPDRQLADGCVVEGEDWALTAIHTPGHAPDHLCFALRGSRALFSGDHVMAWNTTVIAPPEGDMASYMASLERLLDEPAEVFLPAHGGRLDMPQRSVRAYLVHRRWREQTILHAIRGGVTTVSGIVALIYGDLDRRLVVAATLSVNAHLLHLRAQGLVRFEEPLGPETTLDAG